MGQKQTLGHARAMSALPPKADIGTGPRYQLRRTSSGRLGDIRRDPPRLVAINMI
jgi:hypothetical protein